MPPIELSRVSPRPHGTGEARKHGRWALPTRTLFPTRTEHFCPCLDRIQDYSKLRDYSGSHLPRPTFQKIQVTSCPTFVMASPWAAPQERRPISQEVQFPHHRPRTQLAVLKRQAISFSILQKTKPRQREFHRGFASQILFTYSIPDGTTRFSISQTTLWRRRSFSPAIEQPFSAGFLRKLLKIQALHERLGHRVNSRLVL